MSRLNSSMRNQRRGFLWLLLLIVVAVVVYEWLHRQNQQQSPAEVYLTNLDVDSALQSVDSVQRVRREAAYRARFSTPSSRRERTRQPDYQSDWLPDSLLFEFDPNTADSATLIRLGLTPFQASNVLKYRSRGPFRHAEQFAHIYTLTDEQFARLRPFVKIVATSVPDSSRLSHPQYTVREKRDTLLDLNRADTASLQLIHGIGPYYASQIVLLRTRLGGFHDVDQLLLIPRFTPQMLESMRETFVVDTTLIKPIPVNRARASRLRRHPYVRTELAFAIEDLRHRRVHLDSIGQLRVLPDVDDALLERLRPYLSFE